MQGSHKQIKEICELQGNETLSQSNNNVISQQAWHNEWLEKVAIHLLYMEEARSIKFFFYGPVHCIPKRTS